MQPLIILGAGGYAVQIAWMAARSGLFQVVGMLDETLASPRDHDGIPVRASIDDLHDGMGDDPVLLAAVGNTGLRQRWQAEFSRRFEFASFVDPQALVSPNARIGRNCAILFGAICSVDSVIGEGTHINVQCQISHQVTVGKFCNVSSGVKLTGGARIGDRCEIGANACVLPKVQVGNDCIIGAGAVVNRNLPDGVTAWAFRHASSNAG
jgi:sugar O-acyltransferase (sialic acid O-acetyltransferase NeuD family)